MRYMKGHKLEKELQQDGASEPEAAKLARLASRIEKMDKPVVSDGTRRKIQAIAGTPSRLPLITRLSIASSFAVVVVMVVASQNSMPGSALYVIKRVTEDIRAFVMPGYKDNLVDVRKNELEELEKMKAEPSLIDEAAKSYKKAVDDSDKQKENKAKTDDWFKRNKRDYRYYNWRDGSGDDRDSDDKKGYDDRWRSQWRYDSSDQYRFNDYR